MWGQMKRWNDINFAHRMRNMRSQLVFDMDTPNLEKVMEQQWHIENGNRGEADKIQKEVIDPWQSQIIHEKESKLSVKWITRVDPESVEERPPNSVIFTVQVAPIRLGILGEFKNRYVVQIVATEIGIFKVKIDHLHELEEP